MRPVVLVILDGWGVAPPGPGNAVTLAETPCFNKVWANFPHTQLRASGESVGLPRGVDGNSEVGHLNLGAGRLVYQDLPRINHSIADGSFICNPALTAACAYVKESASNLHLLGLLGGGQVHSSPEHLYALLWLCREQGLGAKQVKLHLFTDGRDSPPESAALFLAETLRKMKEIGVGEVVSICGRYYAMDRDKRWERTEKAYRAIVEGRGNKFSSPLEVIEDAYAKGITDEFIPPVLIVDKRGQPRGRVQNSDAAIFFNFRADRARQLIKAIISPVFTPFKRKEFLKNLFSVTMVEYEEGLPVSAVAFLPEHVKLPLARVLSEKGKRQLHVAETEKYPHVTYFFNGGREDPFAGEDRVVIPSPKVDTYDLKPEMSALEVANVVEKRLSLYDFILVNFANPDMVGHTGVLKAGIKAVEVADECLRRLVAATLALDGVCFVTADHGNVEEMLNLQTGETDTEHSTNPVPFIAVAEGWKTRSARELPLGILADVAPTILSAMGVVKPSVMTGRNLL